jgi:hypothetical protein
MIRTLTHDLVVIRGLLRALPGLGGDLHVHLLEAFERPQGATFKKASLLVAAAHKELQVRTGGHAVARVRDLAEYLTVPELEALLAVTRVSLAYADAEQNQEDDCFAIVPDVE